jgi:hypothetical protein
MTAGPPGPAGQANMTAGPPGADGAANMTAGPSGPAGQANMTAGPPGADGAANMTAGPQGIQGVNGTPGIIPDSSQFLFLNGSRAMAGILDMAGYAISNIKSIVNPSDAVNLSYLQGHVINSSYLTSVDQTWNTSYDTIANQSTVNASVRSAIVTANDSMRANVSTYVIAVNNSQTANTSTYILAINETWENNLTVVNNSMRNNVSQYVIAVNNSQTANTSTYVLAVNNSQTANLSASNTSMRTYVDSHIGGDMSWNASYYLTSGNVPFTNSTAAAGTVLNRIDNTGFLSFRGSSGLTPGAAMNFYGRNATPASGFEAFTTDINGNWKQAYGIYGGANTAMNLETNNISNLHDPVAVHDASTRGWTLSQINSSPLTTNIPTGGIIMWSGSIASIPACWHICDGTAGTPDLRNRFVMGAGSTYAVGATGGNATHTNTVAEMASHTHDSFTTTNLGAAGTVKTVILATTGGGTGYTGGGGVYGILNPYYALAYIQETC